MYRLLTATAIMGSVELGLIYAILALGVFLSFRTLNTPDLTVDGSVVSGAAISAVMCYVNYPVFGIILAFFVGSACGCVTAILNTKLKIEALLSGILVMLGLYSINLRIMGNRPNVSLTMSKTIYEYAPTSRPALFMGIAVLTVIIILLSLFLRTRIGFALRATGDNEDMVRAYGISSDNMKILGISISNGLVGFAGGMLAQYQSFADASMGTGMVVIGLASVIIGETIFGKSHLTGRLIAVALGAILYRLIIAQALALGLPSSDLKLVSAVIVTIALAFGAFGAGFTIRGLLKNKAGAKC
ncbi:MAG: ABC transporter permease [Eubacteriales bacterium]